MALPFRHKIWDLVGEGAVNADGSQRQAELLRCRPGDPVRLVRQPENPHDPNAVLVATTRGVGIGYVRREAAVMLAPVLDSGRTHSARIHELTGGIFPDYPSIGCRISVAWDGKPPHSPLPLRPEQNAFTANSDVQSNEGAGCLAMLAVGVISLGSIINGLMEFQ